jgi:hypothetical protein
MEDFFLSWHVNKKDERVILHLCHKCAHVMVNFRVVDGRVGLLSIIISILHLVPIDIQKKKKGPEQVR